MGVVGLDDTFFNLNLLFDDPCLDTGLFMEYP